MCGIIGVISDEPKTTLKELVEGLFYLRRRGQDSFGATIIDMLNRKFRREYAISTAGYFFREVENRFRISSIDDFVLGMGHTRYRTQGQFGTENIHPFYVHYPENNENVLIAHNGDVDKTQETFKSLRIRTRAFVDENRHYELTPTADTKMIADLYIQKKAEGMSATDAIKFLIEKIDGAFSIILYDKKENTFFAFRDKKGMRPMYLAEKDDLKMVISETGFLNGRTYYHDLNIREVNPGEILRYKKGELASEQVQGCDNHAHCFFEAIYIMDVYSRAMGLDKGSGKKAESVRQVRRRITDFFFDYYKENIMNSGVELIVPSMFSGFAYGQRLAHLTGIEHSDDMRKSKSVIDLVAEALRNFIQPEGYRRRPFEFNDLMVEGMHIGMTDDSIMRMDTITQVCYNFHQAGGRALDFYVMSPPNHSGCKYGVATPRDDDLMANIMVKENLIPLYTLDYSRDHQIMDKVNQRATQLVLENVKKVHDIDFEGLRIFYFPPHLLKEAMGIDDICTACIDRRYIERINAA